MVGTSELWNSTRKERRRFCDRRVLEYAASATITRSRRRDRVDFLGNGAVTPVARASRRLCAFFRARVLGLVTAGSGPVSGSRNPGQGTVRSQAAQRASGRRLRGVKRTSIGPTCRPLTTRRPHCQVTKWSLISGDEARLPSV